MTQIVYHGFPYLQTPADTGATSLWPGFSYGGNTSFSEAWGPRLPQWEDYRNVNDSLARLSAGPALRASRASTSASTGSSSRPPRAC